MSNIGGRDVEYCHDATAMLGYYCVDGEATAPCPGVLMIHGGFGLVPQIMNNAHRVAADGYAVLAVDLWGDRHLPSGPAQFSALIDALAQDQTEWLGRIDAAHAALRSQPEVAPGLVAAVGYCFGGSSVLEYARAGRDDLAAVVSLHGGLETVGLDWSKCAPSTAILVLSGAEDPMATAADLDGLVRAMTAAGLDWEVDVYGGTNHAFTFADSPHYDERSDRRSRQAMNRLLTETF